MTRRLVSVGIGIAATCLAVACTGRDRADGNREARDAASAAPIDPAQAARNATLQPGALTTVPVAPVTGWTGPGGLPFEVALRTSDPGSALSRKFGTITLRTSLRTRAPDLGQYPCTSCHLGRRTVMADQRVKDAHQNIRISHPKLAGGTCSTCHAPDNVELLALKSGERATLDHAYRLCAQCHFAQANAWAGGGHGKRLDGWQGQRVVMGCADCHDPHKPALEPRIPFRAPRIERIRGRIP